MRNKINLPKTMKELRCLGKIEMKNFWLRYFKDLPKIMDQRSVRILWYKIQCERYNLSIDQKNITRLNRYSSDPDKYIENSYKTKYHIRSGTEIVKTYKGRQYRVFVKSPKKFIFNDQIYKTLSAVALAMCGKKVSGYDFFGLNNKILDKSVADDENNASLPPKINVPINSEFEYLALSQAQTESEVKNVCKR